MSGHVSALALQLETSSADCRERSLCSLTPGIKSKYCVDCELSVIVKARRKSTAGRRGDDDYAPVTLPSSAKIRKLLEILEQIDRDSEGTDKTIVFSQFTSFLDIIQKFLDKDGFKYIRCKSTWSS